MLGLVIMEQSFFFQINDVNLFGMLYKPNFKFKNNDIGVLICSSLFEEKTRNHTVLVNWCRYLSENGYAAMLFDYRGDGDSEGDDKDYTIKTRIVDIIIAIEEFKKRANINKVVLHGLRYGASLAHAAAIEKKVSSLILWAPVIDLQSELKKLLRTNISAQMILHKKVIYKTEELIAFLMNGKNINVEGYQLNGKLFEEASKFNLLNLSVPCCDNALIIQLNETEGEPDEMHKQLFKKYNDNKIICQLIKMGQEIDWKAMRKYDVKPKNIFNKTKEWINSIFDEQIYLS
jgi:alpha/beta superfamily hydrolase